MATETQIKLLFPRMTKVNITSPETPDYNCIAWAADESDVWWWPDPRYYWPSEVPEECTVEAFVRAYGTLGYEPCTSSKYEDGYEKVAIYVKRTGEPTHAARQLSNGRWTSKLGALNDIQHGLAELEGSEYGTVAQILKRPKS